MDGIAASDEPATTGAPGAGVVDPWARFDGWASWLFLLLALLAGLGILLVAGAAAEIPGPLVLLLVAGVGLAIAVFGTVMVGLRDARSWARPAAAWLLWTLAVIGIGRAVSDLALGHLTIPLDAVGALVVLGQRPPARPPLGREDRRIAALVVAAYVAAVLPSVVVAVALAAPLLGPAPG